MKIKTTRFDGWVIYQPVSVDMKVENLIVLNKQKADVVLREHHRSRVNRVQFQGNNYVIKSPNNKNNSIWIRFTTLYRESEVVKDLKSQLLLDSLKIDTVSPVAALEIRKFGMVIDSRIIYQYKEGEEISVKHYPKMVAIMNCLHANKFLHDDPHTNNFLQKNDDVFVIDCKPRNNFFGQAGIVHNFITLARRSYNSQEIYRLVGASPSNNTLYRLINAFINSQQFRRTIKNKIKLLLGLNYKH